MAVPAQVMHLRKPRRSRFGSMLMNDRLPLRCSSLPAQPSGYSRRFAGKEFARGKRGGGERSRRHCMRFARCACAAMRVHGGDRRSGDRVRRVPCRPFRASTPSCVGSMPAVPLLRRGAIYPSRDARTCRDRASKARRQRAHRLADRRQRDVHGAVGRHGAGDRAADDGEAASTPIRCT